jgi:hypothetical protein
MESIIAALIAVAGTVIAYGFQSSENDKTQAEASGLAQTQRKDILGQQNITNQLNNQKLQLGRDQLTESQKMANWNIGNQQKQMQQAQDEYNNSAMRGISGAMDNNEVTGWNFKNNRTARWGI